MKLKRIGLISNANNYKASSTKLKIVKYSNYPKLGQSKFSIDNLQANYMVNFKGNMSYEDPNGNRYNTINHQTHFFREPKTDEIVQKYILNKFSDDSEVNIVSGACSSGEEAKSYAMMLDSLGDKLHIYGFDISEEVIREANDDTVKLIIGGSRNLGESYGYNRERFLVEKNLKNLTPYQKRCRQKFEKHYIKDGNLYRTPIFSNAQKELNEINLILSDEEKYKQAKADYKKQIQEIKEISSSPIEYNDEDFDNAILSRKKKLENQVKNNKSYYIVQKVKAKKDSFKNCSFKHGDILNLEQLYKPNSVNVFLYRNALYHTLCNGDNMLRFMKEDSQETMNFIAKQMNKILKKDGLVVFGEEEGINQSIDKNVISAAMNDNGFRLYPYGDNDNIWIKVKNV